jgi:hypothetical protein
MPSQSINAPSWIQLPRGHTKLRAFITIALITLHRYGTIRDNDGQAIRRLLSVAGITTPVVPEDMSRGIHWLKQKRVADTDSGASRTMAIWLTTRLTDDGVDLLRRDLEWAMAYVKNDETDAMPGPSPVITFATPLKLTATIEAGGEGERIVYTGGADILSGEGDWVPDLPAPTNGLGPAATSAQGLAASHGQTTRPHAIPMAVPPTADDIAWMRYVMDLHDLIHAQRVEIARLRGEPYPEYPSVSAETAALLEGLRP